MPIEDKLTRFFHRLAAVVTPGPSIRLARVVWPAMMAAKDVVTIYRHYSHVWKIRNWFPPESFTETLQHDYDVNIVPYRAQHPGPLAWLLHKLLRAGNVVFVVNIAPGMGHNTIELDYFLRLSQSGKLPKKRYILLRMPGLFHDDTVKLYRRHFWFASNRMFLNNLLAPVIARNRDLQLNVGLSRLRWQLRDDGTWTPPPEGQTFLYQIGKAENRAEWKRYYELRRTTKHMTPLKDGLTLESELLNFLGGTAGKLALIHVKYHVVNATARPTDPQAYVTAIRWLQDQGYRVVMIGREKMPDAFAELGVLDYANSSIACYRYDLELVAHAAIVITAGSGISLMPDCMDVPLVYLNSWHIGMPMASERCVMVPTLIKQRATNRVLNIEEQGDLYWTMEDKGAEFFPAHDYEPRDAAEDEVLEAVKEVLNITSGMPLTPRQLDYRRRTMKENEALVDARISQYFIDKHPEIMEDQHARTN